jgi:hypothetical protein
VPFKANADRRHHIPKQRHRVTNWRQYGAALRQRGSLTVWFTNEAIASWRAQLRTTPGPVASFFDDGAYDRDDVYSAVIERYPDAAVIVPPRSSAVPSETAGTEPTQRDQHLQLIAECGRMAWQKASGYNRRALVEARPFGTRLTSNNLLPVAVTVRRSALALPVAEIQVGVFELAHHFCFPPSSRRVGESLEAH